ncbi:uncharacterized protein GGS22DRAFT_168692 [Annulohypoxylon maeteangense]|uniref:uncharacterized protein n=1 Tax=Annulohypoxylon maeteangense TaxID=1927788 RepID=UPI002008A453|nr:uncharacterized protein GGS22DRAFT_168692 [Annulohypoxylon maeteangense]KAI0882773.1 hypothetical protein GGS22DRAFT_168692 [Annulohypoxylon maeteangense]
MPMFQIDPERRESAEQPTSPTSLTMASQPAQNQDDNTLRRKQSEESISTELCEGPIPDNPAPQTPERNLSTECSDRSELIERLKRGESPTWKPNRHFESIWGQQPVSPTRSPKRSNAGSPTLLPPATITPEKRKSPDSDSERRQEGLSIERPRSALHSGDFTQDEISRDAGPVQDNQQAPKRQDFDGASDSWLATSPPRDFNPFQFERREISARRPDQATGISSLSSSISSSFIYKPPTSPLVQSESNDDIDLTSPMDGINISSSLPRNPRRHTFMSPHSTSYGMPQSPSPIQPSYLRQERHFPYQAHQPRRSLASTPIFPTTSSSPHTPALLRSRRPSYSSDVSPIQHASMVGSYEESILRGRMSTTPSKPLDFLAQIGVLGLGKCKSSLRCPAHVTLPFPAVFYSYGSSHGHSKVEDGPSPYVGQIDLENGLPNQEDEVRSRRKIQSRAQERLSTEDDGTETNRRPVEPSERDIRKAQRPKRRSTSPRAPPGGSYRIAEKGQIQIIIKNPNKTAVKLFLVPYDLAGMEPGTKTFIRQRSYSAGPIIENMPLKDSGTGDRPILRYLVHLHICCPSRGRYYLYKSIRVVFANRVPDGKERLRNEITLPEPRFTSYKPIRVMHPPISGGTGPGASLAADKAFRRRSSGFYFGGPNQHVYDAAHGLHTTNVSYQSYTSDFGGLDTPIEPVPLIQNETRNTIDEGSNLGFSDPQSPNSSQTSRPNTQNSNDVSSWDSLDGQISRYDKLNKGDVGYGGNAFARLINGNTGAAESLLSQRLRSLGVEGRDMASHESDTMQE